jgi:hypothetical protein
MPAEVYKEEHPEDPAVLGVENRKPQNEKLWKKVDK